MQTNLIKILVLGLHSGGLAHTYTAATCGGESPRLQSQQPRASGANLPKSVRVCESERGLRAALSPQRQIQPGELIMVTLALFGARIISTARQRFNLRRAARKEVN